MITFKTTINQAQEAIAKTDKKFIELLQHGSMKVEYYTPSKIDLQTSHKQDELYIIISGNGNFIRDKETVSFNVGDVLFVPANIPHRFENFSEDFCNLGYFLWR